MCAHQARQELCTLHSVSYRINVLVTALNGEQSVGGRGCSIEKERNLNMTLLCLAPDIIHLWGSNAVNFPFLLWLPASVF
jgi:hypothetical protein